jgi:hypothetical protein
MKGPRVRFWIELLLATISAVASILSAVWPQWIEGIFRFSPDGGSGETEWVLTGTLVAAAVAMSCLARIEWRRVRSVGLDG